MKKLLLCFAAVVFCISVFAYPITPRPLRKLIIESSYILEGKVLSLGSLRPDKKKDFEWNRDYAIVEVIEVLNGKINTKTIKVYYTRALTCPAPPSFEKNEVIIAFLDKSKEHNDAYTVHALSYGVKNALGTEGIAVYKARIREMLQILSIANTQEREEKSLEWLIACVEKNVTRWEGTYELSPDSDFISYYDRDKSVRKDIFLSVKQRKKMFDLLLRSGSLDYSDMGLIDIVTGVDDQGLLTFLKSRLSKFDEANFWTAQAVMKRIVVLTDNDELDKLFEQFSKSLYDEKEKGNNKNIFTLFIEKMEAAELKLVVTAHTFSDS